MLHKDKINQINCVIITKFIIAIKMFSRISYGRQIKARTHHATGSHRFQLPFKHLSTCPFNANGASSTEHPPLVHIPSLPFVGSTLTWYSNTPKIRTGNDFNFWLELRKRFGGFYTIGKQRHPPYDCKLTIN